jgi:hypothetical protein
MSTSDNGVRRTTMSTNGMHQAFLQQEGQLRKAKRAKAASSRNFWRVMEAPTTEYADILAKYRRLRRVYLALLTIVAMTIVAFVTVIGLGHVAMSPFWRWAWAAGDAVALVLVFFRGLVVCSPTRERVETAPVLRMLLLEACALYGVPKHISDALVISEIGKARVGIDPATGAVKIALWAGDGDPDDTPAFSWQVKPIDPDLVPFAEFIEEGDDPFKKGPLSRRP